MMDDLISRQAAIDALISFFGLSIEEEYGSAIQEVLNGLPSAPSAPRWIPCEEQLPKIDMSYPHHEDYLVRYDSGNMDVASWSNVNRFWTDLVTEPYWNCVQFAKVIAWMPLPEPWNGTEDELSFN